MISDHDGKLIQMKMRMTCEDQVGKCLCKHSVRQSHIQCLGWLTPLNISLLNQFQPNIAIFFSGYENQDQTPDNVKVIKQLSPIRVCPDNSAKKVYHWGPQIQFLKVLYKYIFMALFSNYVIWEIQVAGCYWKCFKGDV